MQNAGTRIVYSLASSRTRDSSSTISDLPRTAAHPFYTRLNHILEKHDFDEYVEELCERFYAQDGRPGLPPGRYFRLLLIGYFEGLDAERAIAWRAADSFAVRDFRGLVLPEAPPDQSVERPAVRVIVDEAVGGVNPLRVAVYRVRPSGVRGRGEARQPAGFTTSR